MDNIRTLKRPERPDVAPQLPVVAPVVQRSGAVSDDDILDELVTEGGVVVRVAVKLGIEESHVMRVVTRNVKALSTRLSARLMLKAFEMQLKLQAALEANMYEMFPGDMGRTYAATLQAFNQLSSRFEQDEQQDTDDDAGSAKQMMLERIANMGKREALEELQRVVEEAV